MSSTFSSIRSSPLPDLAYDSYHQEHQHQVQQRNISLREQALLRRTMEATNGAHPGSQPRQVYQGKVELNKAGRPLSFISVNGERYPVDKYSGEGFAFWILLAVLIFLVAVNSCLTFAIYGVLRMGAGMESIELLPDSIVKFFGNTDLDDILKLDGLFQGFGDQPMEFTADSGGRLDFQIEDGNGPSLSIGPQGINISKVSEFRIVDKKGREVFSTNRPTLGLPEGVKFLDVKVAKADKITSGVNETLTLRTTTFAYLKGSEGTHLDAKEINWSADQDIFLKSVEGKLIISGKRGVYIDVNSLPLVRESGVTRKSYTYAIQGKLEAQYKICICMPEGKLFKIMVPMVNKDKIGCHSAVGICGGN